MTFIKDLLKDIGDEHATLAADIKEDETFVDTGSYIFNALVSGSINGGLSGNKITAIAGESSTGKTFFALAVVRNFLDSNPNAIVVYYDTPPELQTICHFRGEQIHTKVFVQILFSPSAVETRARTHRATMRKRSVFHCELGRLAT